MVAPGPDAPRRARGRVRGPFVGGAGEQLRKEDRQHDLARGLGVRAPARLGAQGDQEEGTEVVRHEHIFAGREDAEGAGGEDDRCPD